MEKKLDEEIEIYNIKYKKDDGTEFIIGTQYVCPERKDEKKIPQEYIYTVVNGIPKNKISLKDIHSVAKEDTMEEYMTFGETLKYWIESIKNKVKGILNSNKEEDEYGKG